MKKTGYWRLSNKEAFIKKYGEHAERTLQSMPKGTLNWFWFEFDGKWIMVKAHNSIHDKKQERIKEIRKAIDIVDHEIYNCPRPKMFCSDEDEDEYQDNLEISWYLEELRDARNALENELKKLSVS